MNIRSAIQLTSVLAIAAGMVGCSSTSKNEMAKVDSSASRDPASSQIFDPSVQSNEAAKIDDSSGYVVDAGAYAEGVNENEVIALGGKNGRFIAPEKYVSLDRQKNAPLGRNFYVLTEEAQPHCIRSKFVEIHGKKVLLTYPKASFPTNYCVYQKNYEESGQGFSLVLKDGPVCRPTYSAVKVDTERRRIASIEQVQNTVPISYCVENTNSYGETSKEKHAQ